MQKVSDGATAFAAANYFYAIAWNFFSKIPHDLEAAPDAMIAGGIGEIVASVTNLALSIELYLKCLAIVTTSAVRQTHDLIVLFDALPTTVIAVLEERYRRSVESLPYAVVALQLQLTVTSAPPSAIDRPKPGRSDAGNTNLRVLLSNEKNAFRVWRYLHEGGQPNELMVYEIDYYYLGLFARVLQEYIGAREYMRSTMERPDRTNSNG